MQNCYPKSKKKSNMELDQSTRKVMRGAAVGIEIERKGENDSIKLSKVVQLYI